MNATWVQLGRMKYDQALNIQEAQRDRLLQGETDEQVVFSVEHPPTITIGRSGTRQHIVAPRAYLESIGMEVYDVDRGGDVTYHGPGQLVLYPVFHLAPWQNDVGGFVWKLEETVIRALAEVGISAQRVEGLPGVWVGDSKICAIGMRMRRRESGELVTSHGIALNVNTDLSHFQTIIPCGISDKGVTSIEQQLGTQASVVEWEQRLRTAFAEVFDISFNVSSLDSTRA
ncbi:lipoyl(octanoyl) transferase LipB [Alicyclobacillus contaminans]|uniref:lipoyl(octanoyl) transferase LipB n=1 Tax=Alicyclobacillus contaminans TaxID=392016 RepID=UPI00047BDE8D|nr:lipoyl(octanoyl) transferase LipB [Alicyclobacillus contaminans]